MVEKFSIIKEKKPPFHPNSNSQINRQVIQNNHSQQNLPNNFSKNLITATNVLQTIPPLTNRNNLNATTSAGPITNLAQSAQMNIQHTQNLGSVTDLQSNGRPRMPNAPSTPLVGSNGITRLTPSVTQSGAISNQRSTNVSISSNPANQISSAQSNSNGQELLSQDISQINKVKNEAISLLNKEVIKSGSTVSANATGQDSKKLNSEAKEEDKATKSNSLSGSGVDANNNPMPAASSDSTKPQPLGSTTSLGGKSAAYQPVTFYPQKSQVTEKSEVPKPRPLAIKKPDGSVKEFVPREKVNSVSTPTPTTLTTQHSQQKYPIPEPKVADTVKYVPREKKPLFTFVKKEKTASETDTASMSGSMTNSTISKKEDNKEVEDKDQKVDQKPIQKDAEIIEAKKETTEANLEQTPVKVETAVSSPNMNKKEIKNEGAKANHLDIKKSDSKPSESPVSPRTKNKNDTAKKTPEVKKQESKQDKSKNNKNSPQAKGKIDQAPTAQKQESKKSDKSTNNKSDKKEAKATKEEKSSNSPSSNKKEAPSRKVSESSNNETPKSRKNSERGSKKNSLSENSPRDQSPRVDVLNKQQSKKDNKKAQQQKKNDETKLDKNDDEIKKDHKQEEKEEELTMDMKPKAAVELDENTSARSSANGETTKNIAQEPKKVKEVENNKADGDKIEKENKPPGLENQTEAANDLEPKKPEEAETKTVERTATGRKRLGLKKKGETDLGAFTFGRPKPTATPVAKKEEVIEVKKETTDNSTSVATKKEEAAQPTKKNFGDTPFARKQTQPTTNSNSSSPSTASFKPSFTPNNNVQPSSGLLNSAGVEPLKEDTQDSSNDKNNESTTQAQNNTKSTPSAPIPQRSQSVALPNRPIPTTPNVMMTQSMTSANSSLMNRRNSGPVQQYTRELLLKFQPNPQCMETPPDWNAENLPSVMSKDPLQEVEAIVKAMESKQNPMLRIDAEMGRNAPLMKQASRPGKGGHMHDGPGGGYNRQQSDGHHRGKQKEIILKGRITQKETLVKTKDAFKLGFKEAGKGKGKPEKTLEQQIRADLNKLCPENYASLAGRIKSYEIPNDVEKYKAIIVLIFEKALDDDHFSAVYGDLCSDLSTHNKEVIKKACQAKGKDPNDKEHIKELGIPNFRDTLLRSVQELYEKFSLIEEKKTTDGELQGFEKYLAEDEKIINNKKSVEKAKEGLKPILDEMEAYKQEKRKKRIGSNLYTNEEVMKKLETDDGWKKLNEKKKVVEAEIRNWEDEVVERENKLKRRRFGNVKFIGELFKRGLLIEKIIHKCCIEPLLANPDDDKIKALKVLLELVGQKLDKQYQDRKKMRRNNQQGDNNRERNLMEEYFSKIKKIRTNFRDYGLDIKSQCFLLDLEDLKASNWDNKRMPQDGPKTIDQVRADIERKDREDEMKIEEMNNNNNYYDNRNTGRQSYNRNDKNRYQDKQTGGVSKRVQNIDNNRLNSILGGGKGSSTDKRKSRLGKNSSREDPKKNNLNKGGPRGSSAKDQSAKDLAEIQKQLSQSSRESRVTEEEAIKKARKVLEDVLPGTTSLKDGAHQWLVDEAIPVKHINAIIEQQLDTLTVEGKESEQKLFGELMRYLLKDRKTEFETQFLEGFRKCVINFMECESWTNLPPGKLWDNVAQVLCPLFSTEHCPKVPCFGPEQFNKLVKFFKYKDEYANFDFTGCFAASLLRKLYEKNISQVSNEFNIRKFWKSTDLLWINLYNDDSEKQFFKTLSDKKLKYLYNYDLIKNSPKFKDDFDYKQLDSFLSSGFHDEDSFAKEFKDFVKLDKIYSENNPLWNEETIISAVYIIAESIGNFYFSKAGLDNGFIAAIVENSLSIIGFGGSAIYVHLN